MTSSWSESAAAKCICLSVFEQVQQQNDYIYKHLIIYIYVFRHCDTLNSYCIQIFSGQDRRKTYISFIGYADCPVMFYTKWPWDSSAPTRNWCRCVQIFRLYGCERLPGANSTPIIKKLRQSYPWPQGTRWLNFGRSSSKVKVVGVGEICALLNALLVKWISRVFHNDTLVFSDNTVKQSIKYAISLI